MTHIDFMQNTHILNALQLTQGLAALNMNLKAFLTNMSRSLGENCTRLGVAAGSPEVLLMHFSNSDMLKLPNFFFCHEI